MKRFIRIIVISLAIILILGACQPSYSIAEAYQYEGYSYEDLLLLEELMDEQQEAMTSAHILAEAARDLGCSEDHHTIKFAKSEYQAAHELYTKYKTIYDDLSAKWAEKAKEYPEATYVWEQLMDAGYSKAVAAGIMGNLMVETGGFTLALDWDSKTVSYYGICQWNKEYSEIWGKSLEEQTTFLLTTIKYELNTFGYMYKKGFTYNKFLELTNCRDAALAFASSYERCGKSTYKLRQDCAVDAYNYFIT